MAKPETHPAGKAVFAALVAIGCSGALVFGHATGTTAMVRLANTVIGIGGRDDPTSARVPAKLAGTVVPALDDFHYVPVHYPATVALDDSRDVALPILHEYLTKTGKDEAHLIVAGYSLGTMAAEQEKRNLQSLGASGAPSADQLTFVMIASPFAGNGGIFGRFPGLGIPGVTSGMGAAQPSRYDTTYSANMYDTYADFPAYFNPLALVNSALSIRYGHADRFYDPLDPATSYAYVTEVEDTAAGSTDRYVLYYNPHLPLLGPLRELAAATHGTGFVEPLLGAVEPLLRVLVDMSYTDRVNADPAAAVPFSFVTPPAKIAEALAAIPGALAQGAANLASGGRAPATPPDPIKNLAPVPVVPSSTPVVRRSTPTTTTTPDVPKTELDATVGDGLHPTLTSDGNKVTPGGVDPAPHDTTGDAVTPSSSATPTATVDATPANTPAAQPPSDQADASADADAA
ncbi:PE-PPE domain-containing protein [Mycolicibacterium sp. P1-18]|uniref:PE-PPE domain-containing protein n=1 Tax=Mycolicibacterium sp. P1-18 TaxID=2024615 RepID=UPI0011F23C68|nr:PE-PPE domain-containing protein [Mycolicibacterium sp. P1-18]KAA0097677.1 PE-PPE domain-containing protein [Mycolicibacterium sp. P1-18]